jgi:sugar phosphate isomerase/epimerase
MAFSMKLGMDSYSFHRLFGELTKWEAPSDEQWTVTNFFNFLSTNQVQLASLQTAYIDPRNPALEDEIREWISVDPLREAIFTWGHPNGFDGGKKPEVLGNAIDFLHLSERLGITQMRIVLGNHWNFDTDSEERFRLLRPIVTEILELANKYKIRISIENHADFPVRTLMKFIESFDDPRLGLCLDLGNSVRVGDDPVVLLQEFDIERIFMVQAKDVRKIIGHEEPTGWWPTVLYGTGDVNLGKCIQILKSKGFSDPIVVEISNVFTGLSEKQVAIQALDFLRNELAG